MSLAYGYPSPHPQPQHRPLPRGQPVPSAEHLSGTQAFYHPAPSAGGYPSVEPAQFYHTLPPTPMTATQPIGAYPLPPHAHGHAGLAQSGRMAASAASPTPSSTTNRSGKSRYEAPLSPPPSSPMMSGTEPLPPPTGPSSYAPTTAAAAAGGPAKKRKYTKRTPKAPGTPQLTNSESILSVRERKRNGGAVSKAHSIATNSGSSTPPTPLIGQGHSHGAAGSAPSTGPLHGEAWTPNPATAGTAPMMTPSLTAGSTAASISPEISFSSGPAMHRSGSTNRTKMGAQAPKARTLGLGFGPGVAQGKDARPVVVSHDPGNTGALEALLERGRKKHVPTAAGPNVNQVRGRTDSLASSSVRSEGETKKPASVKVGPAVKGKAKAAARPVSAQPPPQPRPIVPHPSLVTPPPQYRQVATPAQTIEPPARSGTLSTPTGSANVTPTVATFPHHPYQMPPHVGGPVPVAFDIPQQAGYYPPSQTVVYDPRTGMPVYAAHHLPPTPATTSTAGVPDVAQHHRMVYSSPTRYAESVGPPPQKVEAPRLGDDKKELLRQLARHGIHPSPETVTIAVRLVTEKQAADPSRPLTIDDFTQAIAQAEEAQLQSQAQQRPAPAKSLLKSTTTPKRGRPLAPKEDVKGKGRAITPAASPAPTPLVVEASLPSRATLFESAMGPPSRSTPKIIQMPADMPKLEEPLVMTFGTDGRASLQPMSVAVAQVVEAKATVGPAAVDPTPDPARLKRMQAFASPALPSSAAFPDGIGAPGPLVMSATEQLVSAEVPGRGRVKVDRTALVASLGEDGAALAIAAGATSARPQVDEVWEGRNQVWTPPSSAVESAQWQTKSSSWPEGIRKFGEVDEKTRIGRIEAWLESPDRREEEGEEEDEGAGFWTTLPSEWYETEEKEAMDRARTRAALRRYASGQEGDEVEEYVTVSGGKTLRRLVRYRKRAYDDDSLDDPNPVAAKRHCSERRMTETEQVTCICSRGDDGTGMVQCDSCRGWYHLSCLDIEDEDELPEQWHCFRCTKGPPPAHALQRYRQEPMLVHFPYSPRADHFNTSTMPHVALAPSPMLQHPQRAYLQSPVAPPPNVHLTTTPRMVSADWSNFNYSPRSPVAKRGRFMSMVGTPVQFANPQFATYDDFDHQFWSARPLATPKTGTIPHWEEEVVERRASMFPPMTPYRVGASTFATPVSINRRKSRHGDYVALRSPVPVQGYEFGPMQPWPSSPLAMPPTKWAHRRNNSGSFALAGPPGHFRHQSATAPYTYSPISTPLAKPSHARSALPSRSETPVTAQPPQSAGELKASQAGLGIGFGESTGELNGFLEL